MGSRLQNRVLVLNRAWQPVNIVGVRRAIALIFQEHAQVIFAGSDGEHLVLDTAAWMAFSQKNPAPADCIRTVRLALRTPSVILLTAYDRVPRCEVHFSRRNVYLRDGFRCQYCGRVFDVRELTLDHVVPQDRGGKTNWENIVTACVRCNAHKANRLPHQAGVSLRRVPCRPKWRSFIAAFASLADAKSWKPFLG
ncbi:MAG: HNH endonuclease [Puniceicoccales bacterium]|jgi:5-methylcytosine-specific restriction endonuclease McrA|nr:HNH endonuclease [Puniceicoccales bacterium]